ncbi:hypothetical protein [Streptomyces beihaiensis]|uniref:LppP/LprE family lipoprotein n=1 Tax=Streptomyces beihaiensis TaxID=2984495 RepID=A0ABT3TPQ3_9ACTN|nr:hypothetical protein [Streptomyces beihaiensis]MCX3058437.1 LppP/LprE family lipoprotein [Streptomyces beihaiensis]
MRAGSPVLAGLAAGGLCVAVLASCSAGGTGARDEGPAHTDPVGAAAVGSPSPVPSPTASSTVAPEQETIDAVGLVKRDPKVSSDIKQNLKPCVASEYPVDVSYGRLTGASANDIVVNVMTCGDAVGIGTYVYRDEGGKYQNVFEDEEPPVYAEIDQGALVVTKQVYEKGDSVASPSGEEVVTYRWRGGHFVEESRTQTNYSHAVGGGASPAPSVPSGDG